MNYAEAHCRLRSRGEFRVPQKHRGQEEEQGVSAESPLLM